MFDGIYDVLHREMEQMEEKYAGGAPISAQELDHIDKMAHALKCLATYEAMREGYEKRPSSRYSRDYGYRRY